ncbi:putative lipid II flippase FtsW [Desulfonema magnum]|uniref:Probable peptidoglycan glycosyltransferase FtsW n=1 Tax=Desulfonema magnum TaxID=45655 RepID=A0A975BEP8_9BACT|nr:putative lipid II flippase FtsW [Desulfonema magnum]QTA84061.1 putative peptidoglycan glycosyltransferase [Desulfonema magnum]
MRVERKKRQVLNKNSHSEANSPQSAYDAKLLFPALFLVGIGIVMVYSASSALALKKLGTDYFFLKRQAFFSVLGIVLLVICRYFPYKLFQSLAYLFLIIAFFLLITIQVSGLGYRVGGAARWLRFGNFSFQPSEFTRLALIIYLAYSMSKKQDKLEDFYIGFLPHVLVLGIFAILILIQPDFGSVVILGSVTWIMMFVGGVSIKHLLVSLFVSLPVCYLFLISAEYRMQRLISFWDPWQYAADGGYQIIHSLMAFGTGGVWGAGIGNGYQKLFYLPEPHTDFIFSVIGEELGLLGVLIILGLYALILWRGIKIAMDAKDTFGTLLATGLTTAMGFQICINMGVALALLPTKGLTLPFLSYGGTSLLLNMASIGILMNINSVNNNSLN